MWTKCVGKAKLGIKKGKYKLHLVYKLKPNIKRSLMPNFEAPGTSNTSFSNDHPTTLGWQPMLTLLCLSSCTHLIKKLRKKKLKLEFCQWGIM